MLKTCAFHPPRFLFLAVRIVDSPRVHTLSISYLIETKDTKINRILFLSIIIQFYFKNIKMKRGQAIVYCMYSILVKIVSSLKKNKKNKK